MNKKLEKIIRNTYTFVEAEEIIQFIKDKKLIDVIDDYVDSKILESE